MCVGVCVCVPSRPHAVSTWPHCLPLYLCAPPPQLAFCVSYPGVGTNLLIFSLVSAVGQLFIFYSLLVFDSLVCTTITTLRKFATIAISVVFHGNVLSVPQWASVCMVFGAVAYDAGVWRLPVVWWDGGKGGDAKKHDKVSVDVGAAHGAMQVVKDDDP